MTGRSQTLPLLLGDEGYKDDRKQNTLAPLDRYGGQEQLISKGIKGLHLLLLKEIRSRQ
jgi:hypothetical protein